MKWLFYPILTFPLTRLTGVAEFMRCDYTSVAQKAMLF